MKISLFIKIMLFITGFWLYGRPAFAAVISIRLIKDKPSRCSRQPRLTFLSGDSSFSIISKKWYNGENDWEIYFEVETRALPIPQASVAIDAPGVSIVKALVGRTDVSFRREGDKVLLNMVADSSDGRHVATSYLNPKGGPPVVFYHNWKVRANGDYLAVSYPEKALAASCNYALACQEMLRLMGDMSGLHQYFRGEFVLLSCESSAPRAHLDFPPHWHLEYWEHAFDADHGVDWRKKQYYIPHYYLDSGGNILFDQISLRRNYVIVKQDKKKFLPGDTCTWKDAEGNQIFRQVIKDGGLVFIRPDGQVWSLGPDKGSGGGAAVWIYKGDSAVARVTVKDDGEQGLTQLQIIYYREGLPADAWTDKFRYDRFTGVRLTQ